MIKYKLFLGVLALCFLAINCTKHKAEEIKEIVEFPCGDTVSYMNDIAPNIINMSCNTQGCHDNTASAGYSFTSYEIVRDNATIINRVINHDGGVTPMPFGGQKLSDSLITKFKCWIDQGKLDN